MQGIAPSADAQYDGVPPNSLTLNLSAGGAAAMQGIAPSADAQYDGVPPSNPTWVQAARQPCRALRPARMRSTMACRPTI